MYVILDNIRSCHNVGSIFRTADAFGVQKLYLCGYTPTPDNNYGKIAKTALGAQSSVPWEFRSATWRVLAELRERHIMILGLEQHGTSINLDDFKPQKNCAVLVGNETRGISRSLLKRCDAIIEIPMRGTKESLNVSVATGIALYALSRSAKSKNKKHS